MYEWPGPAVSLGRSTPVPDGVADTLAAEGFELVRRPTGGGALVHGWDLSFAAAGPRGVLPAGDLVAAGRWLAEPVREALRGLGFAVEFRRPGRAAGPAGGSSALCACQSSPLDLMLGPWKVAAFAARHTRAAVLQHGSVSLRELPAGLPARLAAAGLGDRLAWTTAAAAAAPLDRFRPVASAELAAALAAAARRHFG